MNYLKKKIYITWVKNAYVTDSFIKTLEKKERKQIIARITFFIK